ncbi:hypothetical protein ACFL59_02095 [Planctomycetota bacterium]
MSTRCGSWRLDARVCVLTLIAVLCVLGRNAEAAPVVDGINESLEPLASGTHVNAEIGWVYTPSFGYELTGVNTKFNAADARTVTIEVIEGLPGGTLLGTTTFTPVAGVFSGGDFASAIPMTAGQSYFIGFRNVKDLGANTSVPGGASLDCYAGSTDTGTYGTPIAASPTAPLTRAILQFESGNVIPEPSALLLGGVSTLLLLGCWLGFRRTGSR